MKESFNSLETIKCVVRHGVVELSGCMVWLHGFFRYHFDCIFFVSFSDISFAELCVFVLCTPRL